MATPRRQSTRKPKPTNLQVEVDEEESMDDEYESDNLSESEASDWEGRPSRTSTGKAPAKRAKQTASPGSKKAPQKVGRGKKSIGLLLDMPLDILFEILGRLTPKDLVNLTRTSKSLRETLMTRNAITVWKTAREILGIPDCPSDFSEPKWAVLISGSNCQSCGAKSVHKVDFCLRRRVCTKCKKDNLVVTSKFAKEYPKLDPMLLNFTPYTNVGGWAHGHASGNRFYWKADIDHVAREWATLQKNLEAGIPKAKERFNEFKLARIDLVDEIIKYANVCEDWADSVTSQRSTEAESKRDKRYTAIVAKFEALGYIHEDIQSIAIMKECNQSTELTDKIWTRIKPILEPIIQSRRTERVARQRRELIQSRMNLLRTAHHSYIKSLVPEQWAYQPTVDDVAKFPIFEEILCADATINISIDSFQEPISILPNLTSEWSEERKADLRDKLPSSINLKIPSSSVAAVNLLDLAVSVFECASKCSANQSVWGHQYGNPLFGRDDVAPHHCKNGPWNFITRDIPTKIAFSEKGSTAAEKLVSLAGLDVSSVTSTDMDKKNLYFFCSLCEPKSFNNILFGRHAYTWRSGVAHSMVGAHSTEQTWSVLTATEASNVTKPEEMDLARNNACWTCNHCSHYLNSWETWKRVVDHLGAAHEIKNVEEPRDLFRVPSERRWPLMVPVFEMPNPNRTLQDPTVDIKCKHCPAPNKRLFKLSGVYSHLKDSHRVQNPVKGRDWEIQKTIAA